MAAKKRSSRPSPSSNVDLYALAEWTTRRMHWAARRAQPKVDFEEHRFSGGRLGLKFDTYPAQLYVVPLPGNGRGPGYRVEFSWTYPTPRDETESVEVEVGKYRTPVQAVEAAVKAATMTEKQIQRLF